MTAANDMAFPCLDEAFTPNGSIQTGLTKREWFAGMAMQGLAGNHADAFSDDFGSHAASKVARAAVLHADALLKALTPVDGEAK